MILLAPRFGPDTWFHLYCIQVGILERKVPTQIMLEFWRLNLYDLLIGPEYEYKCNISYALLIHFGNKKVMSCICIGMHG